MLNLTFDEDRLGLYHICLDGKPISPTNLISAIRLLAVIADRRFNSQHEDGCKFKGSPLNECPTCPSSETVAEGFIECLRLWTEYGVK